MAHLSKKKLNYLKIYNWDTFFALGDIVGVVGAFFLNTFILTSTEVHKIPMKT